MTERRKIQSLIDEIMDEFDFRTVREVMAFLNWEVYHEGGYNVPTETELRRMARKQIESLIEETEKSVENYNWSHTGPFEITIWKEGGFIDTICLEFIVKKWEASAYDF